jgi:dolichyl-phosphate beta-glucosyltransferase
MDTKPGYISIVIPVYNEEKRIHLFLPGVTGYVKQQGFSCELVIVDDGSTDRTAAVVDDMLREQLPGNYRIIKLPKNSGKGAAIRKGMLEATGDYIFFIDADGSTSIEEIGRFMPRFTEAVDIYIARRTLKQKAPFKRKFFGYGYIILANFILHLGVSDITCGFKCYRKRCVQTIFARQRLNNWSFDAENIFVARKHGYRIAEIPVDWEHTPGSKVRVFRNVLTCGLDILRIKLNNLKGLYA